MLSDIIRVTVSLELAATVARGFGIPLVLGQHTAWVDRHRSYQSADDMLDDGFLPSDAEYLKVRTLFSQARRPQRVVVGRRLAPVARVVVVTVDTSVASTLYDFTLNGVVVDFTSGVGTPTIQSIRDGLLADLVGNAAFTGVVTAVATSTNQITITSAVPGLSFAIEESDPNLSFTQTVANVGVAEDLDAIDNAGALYYAVALTSRGAGDILEAAAWVEASAVQHMLYAQTSEAGSASTAYVSTNTDVLSRLRALGYVRTCAWWHHSNTEHLDAAVLGVVLPAAPGTETAALKRLVGVTPSPVTSLSLTQRGNVRGKNANYYYEVSPGTSITWEGITSGGQWADQVRLGDAISADISDRLFNVMLNAMKVEFTTPGITLLGDCVRASLKSFIESGALAREAGYTVVQPRLEDISPANRAARILEPAIEAQAQTSGAIHQAQVAVRVVS